MSEDYREADPGARRRAVVYLLVMAAIGAGLILYYSELLTSASDDPELAFERLEQIVTSLYLFAVPALWFATYMWRLAGRTRESGLWPPPDVPVIRDTRVLSGKPALRRARVAQAMAILVVLTSVLLPTVLLKLVRAVADRAFEVGV